MKLQRVKALVKKEVKKTFREPAVLFMIFLFPIVFVSTFAVSFGGEKQPVYYVGVVNMDQTNSTNLVQKFLSALSDTKILKINIYTNNQTAKEDLVQGKIQALIIIPSKFSKSIASYNELPEDSSRWLNTTILLYLDKSSVIATQAIPPIIQQVLTAFLGQSQQTVPSPINLQIATLIEVKQFSAFEYMAPGMFTFASIFIIVIVAQSFTQDRENGMLKRIRVTPITSTEFMTSQVLSYTLIAFIQAIIIFTIMYFMGFKPNAPFTAYVSSFILILIFSLSNVGFGLITATIAKTANAATGIAFIFVLPQLFLGTFVGTSLSSIAQLIAKFVPSYYVTDALTSLFLRGASITSPAILLDFTVVTISCIAVLVAGIVLYKKYLRT
ncbi:MAG: ABC transporter permease [Nitrososphaeria archaeon]|nr:ABC transporter permease [Nitrososphaeria archaeon]